MAMTSITKKPWRLWAGGAALLLLSACGGGDGLSNEVTTQTMTKVVAGGSCRPKLEDTTFAADIQTLHQANIQPAKIYCKLGLSSEVFPSCGPAQWDYWFDIFIDVPPSQVSQAEALGYTKFVPPGERVPPVDIEYVDFQCRPAPSVAP